MQFTTTITQKGQTTIPAPIRKKLGMKPNTKVVFELKNNQEASIKPVADFLAMRGSVSTDKPFAIDLMEKAVEDAIKIRYAKKFKDH